jgi:hypothetical protein
MFHTRRAIIIPIWVLGCKSIKLALQHHLSFLWRLVLPTHLEESDDWDRAYARDYKAQAEAYLVHFAGVSR